MRLITRDRSFYRSLVALAVPVALQNLFTFAVSFADNLMVGSLGDAAVSGVYMGSQIQTLLQMFSGGIEGAILVLASQYWGKKDIRSIKRIIAIGLQFSLMFGILLTTVCLVFPSQILSLFTADAAVIADGTVYLRIVCRSYVFFCVTQALISSMRSVEVAQIGMGVSAISLVFNILLNYLLIFGHFGFPALGIAGAAIATLISRIVETLVMVLYVAKADKKLSLRFSDLLVVDKLLRKDFIRYGLPIIGGLAYVTMNGLSAAVGIITGKTVGAGQTEKMKEYAYTVQILFFSLGLVTGGIVALLKNPFISLYTGITSEAAFYSRQFITVLSVTIVGTCYQAAGLFGLVKSGGDISFVFKNDTIFVFLVVLPSAIIASYLGAAPWVVFACLKCDQILKCFVAVVKINRFDWMKNLTRTATE